MSTDTKLPFTNCYACKFSGMEPDDVRLICGHPDSGSFGKYVTEGLRGKATPLDHCKGEKFEQHPSRNRDGTLR